VAGGSNIILRSTTTMANTGPEKSTDLDYKLWETTFTKVFLWVPPKLAQAEMSSPTEMCTRESLQTIWRMAREFTDGRMAKNMKDISRKAKGMATENTSILTETFMKVFTQII